MAPIRHNRGFTLAEVLVALTIGTFISLVAVGALKTVSASAQLVGGASERNAELRFAARMIARDLTNLYRDPDQRSMRLTGTSQMADNPDQMPFLCFYTVGRTKARPAQPEGEVYEVEYILRSSADDEDTMAPGQGEPPSQTLYRRLWPNPDRNGEPGGILTPIAERVAAFLVRFHDGKEWVDAWPEASQSIPELVEVTLAMEPEGRGDPLVETFMVSFPRMAQSTEGQDENRDGPGGQGGPNEMPTNGQGPPPPPPGRG